MSAFPSNGDVWTWVIAPQLPAPISYFPFLFRLLAILCATPFAFAVALDVIAYAIARTLHISASRLRVPRSPPNELHQLHAVEDDWEVPSAFTSGLESRQLSPRHTPTPLFPAPSQMWTASRKLRVGALGALALALFLQWFSMSSNASSQATLRRLYKGGASPTALVLTAHPDDEVMFFGPTILNLVASGWNLRAICISDGNADGLGALRSQELYGSYLRLGVTSANVTVVSNLELQDGMSQHWDPQLIANIISPVIAEQAITHLVTFDSTGITQHPNHIALSEVYRHLPTGTRPRLLELHSPSVVTKFTGPLWTLVLAARDALHTGAMRSLVLSTFSPRSSATASPAPSAPALGAAPQAPELKFVASPAQYGTTLHAMRAHASQLVWFRWLYVSFSHLMWVNQIRDATPVAPAV